MQKTFFRLNLSSTEKQEKRKTENEKSRLLYTVDRRAMCAARILMCRVCCIRSSCFNYTMRSKLSVMLSFDRLHMFLCPTPSDSVCLLCVPTQTLDTYIIRVQSNVIYDKRRERERRQLTRLPYAIGSYFVARLNSAMLKLNVITTHTHSLHHSQTRQVF